MRVMPMPADVNANGDIFGGWIMAQVDIVGGVLAARLWSKVASRPSRQNGTSLYDIQEMGGWKSSEMVRRYVHLAPAQMAKHAAVIGSLLYGTNTAQSKK
jgi:hypothetical protein